MSPSHDGKDELPRARKDSQEANFHAMTLSLISVSAALYAVAVAVTSPVPTPWGVGHFRPGVVIPAFFAVTFGPIVGGVGAAIGCFLGDFALSFFGLTTPMLSFVAGVPGNLVGFYVLGWLASKLRSWSSFIVSSFVALVVGNLIAAFGVLAYFWFIVPAWASWPTDLKIATVTGLALFWVVTMIVFVVPFVPVLVMYIKPTLAKIGVKGVSDLDSGRPSDVVKSSAGIALVLAAIYVVVSFIPGGDLIFAGVIPPELILIASAVVFASGVILALIAGKVLKNVPGRDV